MPTSEHELLLTLRADKSQATEPVKQTKEEILALEASAMRLTKVFDGLSASMTRNFKAIARAAKKADAEQAASGDSASKARATASDAATKKQLADITKVANARAKAAQLEAKKVGTSLGVGVPDRSMAIAQEQAIALNKKFDAQRAAATARATAQEQQLGRTMAVAQEQAIALNKKLDAQRTATAAKTKSQEATNVANAGVALGVAPGGDKGIASALRAQTKARADLAAVTTHYNTVLKSLAGVTQLTEAQQKQLATAELAVASATVAARSATSDYEKQVSAAAVTTEKHRFATDGIALSVSRLRNAMLLYFFVLDPVFRATKDMIRDFRDFEAGLIGVKKTTGLTADATRAFGEDIRGLSSQVPSTTSQLLELAQAAGQLGVSGSAELLKFTETMARLGSATDVSGAEGAKQIARLLGLLGEGINTVDSFGASLVYLGNTSKATEAEILSLGLELARATTTYNFTSAQILGISTAFRELGARQESTGSAFQRLTADMENAVFLMTSESTKHLGAFAAILDKTPEAFKKAFSADQAGTFLGVFEEIARLSKGSPEFLAKVLQELDIVGVREVNTFKQLVNTYDNVQKKIRDASKAQVENTALINESNAANESLNAGLIRLKNNWEAYAASLGEATGGALHSATQATNEFLVALNQVGAVRDLPDFGGLPADLVAVQEVAIGLRDAFAGLGFVATTVKNWFDVIGSAATHTVKLLGGTTYNALDAMTEAANRGENGLGQLGAGFTAFANTSEAVITGWSNSVVGDITDVADAFSSMIGVDRDVAKAQRETLVKNVADIRLLRTQTEGLRRLKEAAATGDAGAVARLAAYTEHLRASSTEVRAATKAEQEKVLADAAATRQITDLTERTKSLDDATDNAAIAAAIAAGDFVKLKSALGIEEVDKSNKLYAEQQKALEGIREAMARVVATQNELKTSNLVKSTEDSIAALKEEAAKLEDIASGADDATVAINAFKRSLDAESKGLGITPEELDALKTKMAEATTEIARLNKTSEASTLKKTIAEEVAALQFEIDLVRKHNQGLTDTDLAVLKLKKSLEEKNKAGLLTGDELKAAQDRIEALTREKASVDEAAKAYDKALMAKQQFAESAVSSDVVSNYDARVAELKQFRDESISSDKANAKSYQKYYVDEVKKLDTEKLKAQMDNATTFREFAVAQAELTTLTMKTEFERQAEAIKRVWDTVADSMSNTADGLINGDIKNVGDAIKSLERDILRSLTSNVTKALSQKATDYLSGVVTGTGPNAAGGGESNLLASVFGALGGFSTGGEALATPNGIKVQHYGNFAQGGSFFPQGPTSGDRIPISMNVNSGEKVIVQTPAQQKQQQQGGNISVNIYNSFSAPQGGGGDGLNSTIDQATTRMGSQLRSTLSRFNA